MCGCGTTGTYNTELRYTATAQCYLVFCDSCHLKNLIEPHTKHSRRKFNTTELSSKKNRNSN